MDLRDLGEFGLIREISKQFPRADPKVIKGIGDDCAVTELDDKNYLLSTTDTLIEDVHFSLQYISASLLGERSVAVSLSDIAAMGGTPHYLLISLAIPGKLESQFVTLFYEGVRKQTEPFSVELIGGNTAFSPDRVVISTFVLGIVPKGEVVYRNGASQGDLVYVTGTLGDAALGLKILKKSQRQAFENSPYGSAVKAYLKPEARLEMGRELARKGLATAMIDVSDGLLRDMRHIMQASHVGARLEFERIPRSSALKKHLGENPGDADLPMSGGEDYELLFTSPHSLAHDVEEAARELSCQVSCIGKVVPSKEGLTVIDEKGKSIAFKKEGFDHFKQE
jgi:thiamine-monophosphate kinase